MLLLMIVVSSANCEMLATWLLSKSMPPQSSTFSSSSFSSSSSLGVP